MKNISAADDHSPPHGVPQPGRQTMGPKTGPDLEQARRSDRDIERKKPLLKESKLTITEAARALSIGATSLRRIIANKEIPVVRMTKKTLILESDLEAYLAASRGKLTVAKPVGRRLPQLPPEVAKSKHLN